MSLLELSKNVSYTAPYPSDLSFVARDLYHAPSVRGLVAALQALPLGYTTYGGDDEYVYTLLDAIQIEATKVLAFVKPHTEAYEQIINERYGV